MGDITTLVKTCSMLPYAPISSMVCNSWFRKQNLSSYTGWVLEEYKPSHIKKAIVNRTLFHTRPKVVWWYLWE